MKPLTLTMNAFGPFVTKQEIDFTELSGEEIFLVTGETGAGKTTIFDAMSFALYGNASGEGRKPGMFKSDHAPTDQLCWVELSFSLRGSVYKLRRSPAQQGLKRDGSLKDIGPSAELTLPDGSVVTGANAVTERVEQILGLNHRQFKQTTMLAQGEFKQLIEANGKEKQQIFSKIFGTSVYSGLTERLAREEARLQHSAQALRESIARHVRELGSYGCPALSGPDAEFMPYDHIERLVNEAIALNTAKTGQLGEEISLLEARKENLNPERARALNEKLDRRDALRRQSAELKAAKPRVVAAEKRLRLLTVAAELAGREEIILASKAQSEEYGQQIAELQARLEQLDNKMKALSAGQNAATPEIRELEARFARQESKYNRLYREFFDGQAGIMAGRLTDGEACPVCGSAHHPAPAVSRESTPSERDVNDARSAAAKLSKLLEQKRAEAEKARWQAKSDRDKCAERLGAAKAHRDSVAKQFEAHRAAFVEKLELSGFSGYKDYRRALEGKADIPLLERQTAEYRKRRVETAAQLRELRRDVRGQVRGDMIAIIAENEDIIRQLAAMRETRAELHTDLSGAKRRLRELHELYEENSHNDHRYRIAHELAALARGSRTVSFERYILTTYFDDIIKLSNIHLQRMTGSRYRLRRMDNPEKGAGSGLDMEIIDSYTGKPRDVSTLSGGESFKASLALALGLSGVVQIYAGGVSIDAMFIDEGFGSLDERSLESAVETLISLKKSGRMVGIISHVRALRGYIPKKLAVRYGPTGSTVGWI